MVLQVMNVGRKSGWSQGSLPEYRLPPRWEPIRAPGNEELSAHVLMYADGSADDLVHQLVLLTTNELQALGKSVLLQEGGAGRQAQVL